jgi:preprotein translocase subunit SecA
VFINHEASFLYDPSHVRRKRIAEEEVVGSLSKSSRIFCVRALAGSIRRRYHVRYQQRVRFRLFARQSRIRCRQCRQRDYHFAIVDEIDSILIDEARTPLIISAPISEAESLYGKFASIAESLVAEEDYTVDEKHKQIQLTDAGIEKAEKALGIENIYTDAGIKFVHHLETAVRAKALYERDKEYVVRDGKWSSSMSSRAACSRASLERWSAPGDRSQRRRRVQQESARLPPSHSKITSASTESSPA